MNLKRYLNKNHIITAVISYKQDIPKYSVKVNLNEDTNIGVGELMVTDNFYGDSSLERFLDRKNRDLHIYNIPCKDKGIYIYDKEFSEEYITMRPFIAILLTDNVSYVHAFESDEELDNWVSKMGLDKFLNSKDIFCPDDI